MPKIKFHEYIYKYSDGYTEKRTVAYANVTNYIKNMMDNIEKAYYVINDNYDPKDYTGTSAEIKKRLQDSIKIDENCIDIDNNLYIKFKSGKVICFFTSEYGSLRVDNMKMFES